MDISFSVSAFDLFCAAIAISAGAVVGITAGVGMVMFMADAYAFFAQRFKKVRAHD